MSIAKKIYVSLAREVKENNKRKIELCKEFIQDQFDEKIKTFEKIQEDTEYSFPRGFLPSEVPFQEAVHIYKDLGFIISFDLYKIRFSIPKRESGKKMTKAQLMLFHHNGKVNKLYNSLAHLDNQEARRIWQLIKAREFAWAESSKDTFTLSIPLSENYGGEIGKKKIIEFLSYRAFNNVNIEENTLYITLVKWK